MNKSLNYHNLFCLNDRAVLINLTMEAIVNSKKYLENNNRINSLEKLFIRLLDKWQSLLQEVEVTILIMAVISNLFT